MATSKKQQAAAEQPTAKFIVLSNLKHDGDRYASGETVELTEVQALALGARVVEPAKPAADPKK